MEGGYGAVVSGAPEKGSGAPPFAAANGSNGAKRDGESWSLLANDISLAEAGQNGRGNWASNGTKHVGVFGKGARRTDNNRLVTILLVLNYMIGSGILNTSQTALRSGLAATTVLYVIACAAVWLGGVVLILAAEASCQGGHGSVEELDYTVLVARTLGEHGPALVDLSVVTMNFGAVCSYIILIGGLVSSMLLEWSAASAEPGSMDVIISWWQSFYFVTPVMVLFFVLPPCLVRHFSNLRWLSAFSLFAISAVVALVMFGSSTYASYERSTVGDESELNEPLVWWNWTGAFSKLGSLVFALNCAAAVLHSYSAMDKRTERRERKWKSVMSASVLAGGILCYVTGLAGYLAFRGATQGDILDNFSGPVAAFFKILVVVHLVFYIPNEAIILRHNLYSLMGRDVMKAGFASVSAATFGLLVVMVVVVTTLMSAGIAQGDLFGYILDLTGGVTGSVLSFVLPGMAYLAATKDVALTGGAGEGSSVRAYRIGCRVLIVFGLAMIVLVPAAVMRSALYM
ncbi:unnamed protein product [Ascophyllum nodosum]